MSIERREESSQVSRSKQKLRRGIILITAMFIIVVTIIIAVTIFSLTRRGSASVGRYYQRSSLLQSLHTTANELFFLISADIQALSQNPSEDDVEIKPIWDLISGSSGVLSFKRLKISTTTLSLSGLASELGGYEISELNSIDPKTSLPKNSSTLRIIKFQRTGESVNDVLVAAEHTFYFGDKKAKKIYVFAYFPGDKQVQGICLAISNLSGNSFPSLMIEDRYLSYDEVEKANCSSDLLTGTARVILLSSYNNAKSNSSEKIGLRVIPPKAVRVFLVGVDSRGKSMVLDVAKVNQGSFIPLSALGGNLTLVLADGGWYIDTSVETYRPQIASKYIAMNTTLTKFGGPDNNDVIGKFLTPLQVDKDPINTSPTLESILSDLGVGDVLTAFSGATSDPDGVKRVYLKDKNEFFERLTKQEQQDVIDAIKATPGYLNVDKQVENMMTQITDSLKKAGLYNGDSHSDAGIKADITLPNGIYYFIDDERILLLPPSKKTLSSGGTTETYYQISKGIAKELAKVYELYDDYEKFLKNLQRYEYDPNCTSPNLSDLDEKEKIKACEALNYVIEKIYALNGETLYEGASLGRNFAVEVTKDSIPPEDYYKNGVKLYLFKDKEISKGDSKVTFSDYSVIIEGNVKIGDSDTLDKNGDYDYGYTYISSAPRTSTLPVVRDVYIPVSLKMDQGNLIVVGGLGVNGKLVGEGSVIVKTVGDPELDKDKVLLNDVVISENWDNISNPDENDVLAKVRNGGIVAQGDKFISVDERDVTIFADGVIEFSQANKIPDYISFGGGKSLDEKLATVLMLLAQEALVNSSASGKQAEELQSLLDKWGKIDEEDRINNLLAMNFNPNVTVDSTLKVKSSCPSAGMGYCSSVEIGKVYEVSLGTINWTQAGKPVKLYVVVRKKNPPSWNKNRIEIKLASSSNDAWDMSKGVLLYSWKGNGLNYSTIRNGLDNIMSQNGSTGIEKIKGLLILLSDKNIKETIKKASENDLDYNERFEKALDKGLKNLWKYWKAVGGFEHLWAPNGSDAMVVNGSSTPFYSAVPSGSNQEFLEGASIGGMLVGEHIVINTGKQAITFEGSMLATDSIVGKTSSAVSFIFNPDNINTAWFESTTVRLGYLWENRMRYSEFERLVVKKPSSESNGGSTIGIDDPLWNNQPGTNSGGKGGAQVNPEIQGR